MGWLDRFKWKKPAMDGKRPASGARKCSDDAQDVPTDEGDQYSTPGRQTQFLNTRTDALRRQFVIGLDFGTAFTKVVIGETSKAYAVPFTEYAEDGNPYLLPGVFSVAGDRARLGAGKAGASYSDLKMRFLDGDLSDDARRLAATFLALVLRHARAWFLESHKDDYGQFRLDWCVNVGLPTHQYHNERLTKYYRALVQAAWLASTKPEPITTDLIEDCFAHPNGSPGKDKIGLFPEFVAQVNSYVKSPERQSDLHLLVDIGAGTVDVAVFNVHENDQGDLFPIFAKSVSKYGVNFLQRTGCQEIKELLLQQIKNDIDLVKTEKYPEFWKYDKVLPFFLCGGGSQVEFYRDIASNMIRDSWPCKLRKQELPKPQRLVARELPAMSYHRLSVAYGLAFDAFDIGQIVPEHETAVKRETGQSREICTSCDGSGGARGNDCRKCEGSGWLRSPN